MEYEGIEQEILLEPENAIVGAVYSVNGKTGDVVLTTSDLENDSDYQTGDEVDAAIATAIAGKQDTLTAGNNIQISDENVISATDTTYSAGNGLNLSSENAFSVDTTVVATQQNLATEVQNRENADNALQAQIDGISASSDVVDIVGTYADLQNYDTQHLKDNDIIKVLQDETQNDATTYYRWSTTTETFTLIGQEGPYYTKAAVDAQFVPQTRTVNGKALSSNITLNASDVSALGTSDVVQTTGTSTSQVMSQNATTQALSTKLNITDYVVDDELKNSTNPVQNGVLYGLLGNMPTDFFSGNATTEQTGTEAQFTNALKISDIELQGDTFQQTYSGKNLAGFTNITATSCTYTVNNGIYTLTATANSPSMRFELNNIIPAGTYTWSGSLSGCTLSPRKTDGTSLGVNSSEVPHTITISESMGYITFFFGTQSGETAILDLSNFQLESGSSVTSFEPYTGGTASPNPDYPQDVQVVTGEQTVTISDGVNSHDYTISLGNMFDASTIEGGDIKNGNQNIRLCSRQSLWLEAGTYTFSTNLIAPFDYTISTNSVGAPPLTIYPTYSYTSDWTQSSTTTFTINQAGWFAVQFRKHDNSNLTPADVLQFNYQLNRGSTVTTPIELAKIGTYQDYIYKSGDDWYVHKAIGKIQFDGNETVRGLSASGGVYRYYIDNYASQFNGLPMTELALCTHFEYAGLSSGVVGGNVVFFNMSSGTTVANGNITFNVYDQTTAADFKTWLGDNNPVLYYQLLNSTDTQITDSTLIGQLNALYNAKMLAGQTNFAVSAVSPNLPAILDITVFNANAQGLIANIRG